VRQCSGVTFQSAVKRTIKGT
nr:Chain C, nsp5/6 peptidyl substrate [Severe acute respiratory syndrome coronavirus 2]